MSKFFAQVLVSLMLGLSAAAGFSPDLRGEVAGTIREIETFVQGTVESVFDTAANVDADAEVAVDASGEASLEADVRSDADAELDLNSRVDDVSEVLPEASLEGSLSAEAETDAGVQSDGASLDLENTLETILDFGIGIGE